jgi:UDP-N-acetylmuramyl pentapeptide phosphotransferase/UDP-N-acetylglucosamine-1-phosphate transferase
MSKIVIFTGLTAAVALAAALVYRRLWNRWRRPQTTPTGFGVFLAVALLAGAAIFHMPSRVLTAFAVLTIASAVYWLDDAMELSARLRMGISFVTGACLCALLLPGDGGGTVWLLAASCMAAGALNVVLTNIVNFYDGADLNLATFIALTAGVILLFASSGDFLATSAVACLAFIAPFAALNSRPQTIYLGDAGSFAFAGLLTIIAVTYFARGGLAAQVAIPLGLPALDTFYVFCVRIIEKHDLMTRNYLHLYQKLDRHYEGFGYLLPQIVNVGLALACAAALQAIGFSQLAAVTIAMVVVTVPFYFACRRFLLPAAEPDGAPG